MWEDVGNVSIDWKCERRVSFGLALGLIFRSHSGSMKGISADSVPGMLLEMKQKIEWVIFISIITVSSDEPVATCGQVDLLASLHFVLKNNVTMGIGLGIIQHCCIRHIKFCDNLIPLRTNEASSLRISDLVENLSGPVSKGRLRGSGRHARLASRMGCPHCPRTMWRPRYSDLVDFQMYRCLQAPYYSTLNKFEYCKTAKHEIFHLVFPCVRLAFRSGKATWVGKDPAGA